MSKPTIQELDKLLHAESDKPLRINLDGSITDCAEVPEREQHLSLLREARTEINRLRQHNEVLHAKVSTMELLSRLGRDQAVRDYQISGTQGFGPDVSWQIDRALERAQLEDSRKAGNAINPHASGHAGAVSV